MKPRTSKSRFTRALKRMKEWFRFHRHRPIPEQHKVLCRKLRGHSGYFGITGNSRAIERYRAAVLGLGKKWLGRRSHRARMTWGRFKNILERHPLPKARAIHSIYRYAANP